MAKRKADFTVLEGKIAVVTGGGSGMGRELCRQLAAVGCHVAFCDLSPAEMEETKVLCEQGAPPGTRVRCFVCDVSSVTDVLAFRDAVMEAFCTDVVHYVFNNAGVGGVHSFLDDSPEGRARWEKTFNIDWYGVYYPSRAFVPLLKRAAPEEVALVNTSSVNGFYASLGPGSTNSSYAASKFAVKGFTEALVVEFATYAKHIHVAVVMPGHVGTSIQLKINAEVDSETGEWEQKEVSTAQKAILRERIMKQGPKASMPNQPIGVLFRSLEGKSDAEVDAILENATEMLGEIHKNGGITAAEAAGLIIRGTLEKRWRILIGDDAHRMDQEIRRRQSQSTIRTQRASSDRLKWRVGQQRARFAPRRPSWRLSL